MPLNQRQGQADLSSASCPPKIGVLSCKKIKLAVRQMPKNILKPACRCFLRFSAFSVFLRSTAGIFLKNGKEVVIRVKADLRI